MDDYTAKSDVYFLQHRSELITFLTRYIARAQNVTNCRLLNIRLDRAGENKPEVLQEYCNQNGIRLEYSPAYAPQSNGIAKRFMQELGLRCRVLLHAANFDDMLWAEAMNHGNWLRNRLPSERILGNIPMLLWDAKTRINFGTLPIFGQEGFAFLYTPSTKP